MSEDSEAAIKYIRTAISAAGLVSAREISFANNTMHAIDPLGVKHLFTSSHPAPARDAIEKAFRSNDFWNGRTDRINVSGHGTWEIRKTPERLLLKPTSARKPVLEDLFSCEHESLAKLRSLYSHSKIDIFVATEGETRATELARAFATELNLSGRSATLSTPPELHYRPYERQLETAEDQNGPPIFTRQHKAEPGQSWQVIHSFGKVDMSKIPPLKPGDNVSRVVIWNDENMAPRFSAVTEGAFAPSRRPAIVVGVKIVKSEAVATVIFSEAAKKLATTSEIVTNAPWTRRKERKEARLRARPSAPKTWHKTIESVAEAYHAREAPRGYVSSRSLYFHGPVAFSLYDSNPVSAIVDVPNGETLMFMGRASGFGGTTAGTISCNAGAIYSRADKTGIHKIPVDELTDFLTFAGLPLDQIAWKFRKEKNEKDFPNTCEIDLLKLGNYITARHEKMLRQLEIASRTTFATHLKASAWSHLAKGVEYTDTLSRLLGVELPYVGDLAEYQAEYQKAHVAVTQRQSELDARRKLAAQTAALVLPM